MKISTWKREPGGIKICVYLYSHRAYDVFKAMSARDIGEIQHPENGYGKMVEISDVKFAEALAALKKLKDEGFDLDETFSQQKERL